MDRLVDHDHRRAEPLRVPGRLSSRRDVVTDADHDHRVGFGRLEGETGDNRGFSWRQGIELSGVAVRCDSTYAAFDQTSNPP